MMCRIVVHDTYESDDLPTTELKSKPHPSFGPSSTSVFCTSLGSRRRDCSTARSECRSRPCIAEH